ncbi:unnamed protein product [Boreogadus saida]
MGSSRSGFDVRKKLMRISILTLPKHSVSSNKSCPGGGFDASYGQSTAPGQVFTFRNVACLAQRVPRMGAEGLCTMALACGETIGQFPLVDETPRESEGSRDEEEEEKEEAEEEMKSTLPTVLEEVMEEGEEEIMEKEEEQVEVKVVEKGLEIEVEEEEEGGEEQLVEREVVEEKGLENDLE